MSDVMCGCSGQVKSNSSGLETIFSLDFHFRLVIRRDLSIGDVNTWASPQAPVHSAEMPWRVPVQRNFRAFQAGGNKHWKAEGYPS
jgi:hypothetical protein